MFDFVRRHTRIMQFLLFLLIFPSFVLFGIDGYNRFRDKGETVATVDGQEITQSEWDNAHRTQVERMRASMPSVDVKLFDTPQAKYSTLERLVRDRLLQVAANQLRVGASDQRLASELQQNPSIAGLRRADGSLDMERVRADLAARQVMAGVGGTSFAPAVLADVTVNAFYEQRQVQVARFVAADFVSKVNLTGAQLQDYYKAHSERFQSAEQADVSYVVLDLASVQKGIVVPDAELKTYYEQNLSRLSALEEQRAGLEVEVRRQLAQRKFAEAAEQFTNMVYEQSDSLKPVAERLKLEILSVNNLGRDPAASGVMANPKLLAAIFSADSMEKKRNTEAIEIGPNQLVSARMTRYTPARTLPFDEVKARVQQQLQAEKSAELARQDGIDKLGQWKSNPESARLATSIVLSREQTQQQPSALVETALRADTQKLPAWVGVDLGTSGYAVVKVEKIVPREEASNQNRARERAQYAQWWASAEGLAYYGLLKEKFKVEIKAPRL